MTMGLTCPPQMVKVTRRRRLAAAVSRLLRTSSAKGENARVCCVRGPARHLCRLFRPTRFHSIRLNKRKKERKSPVKLEHFHTWARRPSPECVGSEREKRAGLLCDASGRSASIKLPQRDARASLPPQPPSAFPSVRGALPSCCFCFLSLSDSSSRFATDIRRITVEQPTSYLTAAWR